MIRRNGLILVILAMNCLSLAHARDQQPLAWTGSVRLEDAKLTPLLDSIVSRDAVVEKLPDRPGVRHYEGPVWIQEGGYLLYGDWLERTIVKWTPGKGGGSSALYMREIEIIGMTLDAQNRIVVASGGQVFRLENDGQRSSIAGEYEGKPINPNDLAAKSNGALYFSNPGEIGWDPVLKRKTLGAPPPRIFLVKEGRLSVVSLGDVPNVNGLVLSPDEKHLYAASTSHSTITRFDVLADDTLANPRLFINMWQGGPPCYPVNCGMARSFNLPASDLQVDERGNVYASGSGGVWIISPEGKHLGTITGVHLPVLALAFGGDDGKTLYMSSDVGLMIPDSGWEQGNASGLARIRLKIPGMEHVRALERARVRKR